MLGIVEDVRWNSKHRSPMDSNTLIRTLVYIYIYIYIYMEMYRDEKTQDFHRNILFIKLFVNLRCFVF